MCLAVGGILGAVVGVAQAAVSFGAAQQDYEAKAAQWRQNFTNAMHAGVEDQKKVALRMTQEQSAFAQKQHLTEIEGAEAVAKAEVSGAEGGVTGLSLTNIVTGLERDVLRNQEADKTNHYNTVAQLQAESEGTEVTIQNQINSIQRPVAPNPLGYMLQGIGGALGAVSSAA